MNAQELRQLAKVQARNNMLLLTNASIDAFVDSIIDSKGVSMLEGYEDIISRISEPPLWYDQNGTPRYAKFHPNMCPNIYSDKVVLAQIACQECGEKFFVEMHASIWDSRSDTDPRKWHCGDPPRHCKGAGDTMNCEDIAIVECWHRSRPLHEWRRVKKFEGLVDDTAFQQSVQRTAGTVRQKSKSKSKKATAKVAGSPSRR